MAGGVFRETGGRWTLVLEPRDRKLIGTIRDNDFTCTAEAHHVVGNSFALSWQSVFSWTNRVERGSGTLELSNDQRTLTGTFTIFGTTAAWKLERQGAAAPPPLPPSPAPPAAQPPLDWLKLLQTFHPTPSPGGGPPKSALDNTPQKRLWDMSAELTWRRAIKDEAWFKRYAKTFEEARRRKPTREELYGE
jgi:hypothetical protein